MIDNLLKRLMMMIKYQFILPPIFKFKVILKTLFHRIHSQEVYSFCFAY